MGSILSLHPTGAAEATMSSREIADICEARHNDVIASIERLINEGVLRIGRNTARPYLPEGGGRPTMVYDLAKRDCLIVISGYSAVLRAKIIDRWIELESTRPAPAPALPRSFAEALRLAADQQDVIAAQAEQLAAAAPAVEFVGRYVESTGLMTFRQVAKLLQVKEPEFRQFLHAAKIMYLLNGEWTAHAQHIEAGRFEVRAGTAKNDHAYNTAKFTAKGVEWVAGELAKWQLKQKQAQEVAHA